MTHNRPMTFTSSAPAVIPLAGLRPSGLRRRRRRHRRTTARGVDHHDHDHAHPRAHQDCGRPGCQE